MTTNLNIGDRILKLETFLWLQSIWLDIFWSKPAYNLIFSLYILNQKQKKVDIFKIFKDEMNNKFLDQSKHVI